MQEVEPGGMKVAGKRNHKHSGLETHRLREMTFLGQRHTGSGGPRIQVFSHWFKGDSDI